MRVARHTGVLLAALLWLLAAPAMTAPSLADEVVAAVGASALTRSQIILEARLLLLEKDQNWAGRLPQALLKSVLEAEISKELLYHEMERMAASDREGQDPEAEKAIVAFFAHFASRLEREEFLVVAGVSETALKARIRRHLKLEHFMTERLALYASVSDEELTAEIKRRGLSFQTPKEEADLRDYLRNELSKAKRDAALSDWLKALAQRMRVRRLADFTNDEPALNLAEAGGSPP